MNRLAIYVLVVLSLVTIGALTYKNVELSNKIATLEKQGTAILEYARQREQFSITLQGGRDILRGEGTTIEKFNNLNSYLFNLKP